jgi:hypothetical protein
MEETRGTDLAVPTRVCSKCSVQSQTGGDFCPNCGRSYIRSGLSKRTKLVAGGIAVAIVLGAGAVGVVAKVRHDHAAEVAQATADRNAAKAAKAVAHAKAAKAAKARTVAAKRAANNAARRDRHDGVKQMEQSITKDARKDVGSGLLDGPIYYTSCNPLGGGSTDDLTAITTTFSCIAVTKKNSDGTASGYAYHATENWSEGSYSWGLGNG